MDLKSKNSEKDTTYLQYMNRSENYRKSIQLNYIRYFDKLCGNSSKFEIIAKKREAG